MSIYTDQKTSNSKISEDAYVSSGRIYTADYLGIMSYELALQLQEMLVQARAEDKIPDVVLLLQHPPVFTTGQFRGEDEIIAPPEVLTQNRIDIFHTNRGGSVTYHGPGQLVGYPILNLKENRLGVREYIWKLEEVIIKLLLAFGIQGYRIANYPGSVWAGKEKICSIGIHVSRNITMHGFALNVNTDLRHFGYINPCGIKGEVMTSLSKILGYPIEIEDIIDTFLASFSEIFESKHKRGLDECLTMLDVQNG